MAEYPDMWNTVLIKCPQCKAVLMSEDLADHKTWHEAIGDAS